MKTPVSWVGNKTAILHILYALFPLKYERYIEPFGGSGAVLLGKPVPDKFEVYNDYNRNLITLFRCMRDRPVSLIRELGFLNLQSRDDFVFLKRFFQHEEFTDEFLSEVRNHHKEYGIRLVNISVGAVPAEDSGEGSELIRSVEETWSCGLVVVTAAGNEGPREGTITTPGISRKVITVGTSDDYIRVGKSTMVNYSGRGPTDSCILKPEIVAPGQHISSCSHKRNGYTIKSGTSMSAAVVTGALALLLEKEPAMTNKDVKLRLYSRALDLGWSTRRQGWGMLDVRRLLS